MCSWWLAALSWQHTHSCIMSCSEIFGKTSNHPDDSAPLQPRFGALWLLAFPKTKITFEREEISDHWWDSGKYDRAADGDWENCVRSQGAYLEGDWGVIVFCTMFLVSCFFFNKCLFFILCGWILSEQTSYNGIILNQLKKKLILATIFPKRGALWKVKPAQEAVWGPAL